MWNDPSKRPLIVFGAILLLAIGGGGLWWWNDKAPERHLKDIIEQAYDHAGIDGPDAFSKYNRQTYTLCGDGEYSEGDAWRSSMAGLSHLDLVAEAGPAAVRLADGLEQDGWEVQRYLVPSGDDDVAERRLVQAERNRDTLDLLLQGLAVSVSASTGPCNSATSTDLNNPPSPYIPVDSFPE